LRGNSAMIALLPDSTLNDEDMMKWISTPMPDAFSNLDDMNHEFLDPETNVEYGGPAGIRLGFFLILRMITHAEQSFTDIQNSPTASSSIVPKSILQYTCRTMVGLQNHIKASIKVLELTSEQRKLSENRMLLFKLMLDPDLARDMSAISVLDTEIDNVTISSGGPVDEGLNLPEPKGRHPAVEVSAMSQRSWCG
jgi:hypothetical protein